MGSSDYASKSELVSAVGQLTAVGAKRNSAHKRATGALPKSPVARPPLTRQTAVLSALLVAFLTLQCFLTLQNAVKIGADEDFELSKAALALKGYKLYTQVWNDQPPLYTTLLTTATKWTAIARSNGVVEKWSGGN